MDHAIVRDRLDALIRAKGEDYTSLSRLLGRNPAYVQQFIKRGVPKKLDEGDRRELARYFNVSESDLGGPANSDITVAPTFERAEAEFLAVPRYDVGASAGPGALNDSERAGAAIAFRTDWLRQAASGSPSALSVIRVAGDSMVPTLSDGDDILVDSADAAPRLRDGIYVLRIEDQLLVKRIAISPAGGPRFIILSDNSSLYPPLTDCDPASVNVIGRVIWVGRRL